MIIVADFKEFSQMPHAGWIMIMMMWHNDVMIILRGILTDATRWLGYDMNIPYGDMVI